MADVDVFRVAFNGEGQSDGHVVDHAEEVAHTLGAGPSRAGAEGVLPDGGPVGIVASPMSGLTVQSRGLGPRNCSDGRSCGGAGHGGLVHPDAGAMGYEN